MAHKPTQCNAPKEADAQAKEEERLNRVVDLFFEAGMLRHTPRSGWIFLGSGQEDVAQHSFRVALMSYVLAKLAGADAQKAASLGLFHDLHEARTGDLNYMNQRYEQAKQREAMQDAVKGTGLEEDLLGLFDCFESSVCPEAMFARDADQLDLIFNLKVELDKGNTFAAAWLESALARLQTKEAQRIAQRMLETEHFRWWFGRVEKEWWVNRGKKPLVPDSWQENKK